MTTQDIASLSLSELFEVAETGRELVSSAKEDVEVLEKDLDIAKNIRTQVITRDYLVRQLTRSLLNTQDSEKQTKIREKFQKKFQNLNLNRYLKNLK